ncbi:MAG: class I SAM-dependent methyltransferase [Candidatus Rokubacteria bacterium]|nr:class I SAM-dependent methyltransferase [Candidatus Rokubacteria bacterium]
MAAPRPAKSREEYNALVEYYRPQFATPYENVKFVRDLLVSRGRPRPGDVVLDIGGGAGVMSFWLAKAFPGARFVVRDFDPGVVEIGARLLAEHGATNVEIGVGNWLEVIPDDVGRFAGVVSTHALCCLPDARPAIRALTALRPEWILIESLFYDGPLDVLIHIRNHVTGNAEEDPDGHFNIFSLPLVRSVFRDEGYARVTTVPFEIGIDLPRPPDGRRGTYTAPLGTQPRAQFSGPVYLPWHAVVADRDAPPAP